MDATDFLKKALATLEQRGKQRSGGASREEEPSKERTMDRIVKIFNEARSKDLTVEDGWAFMICVKLARSGYQFFVEDDYVDGCAYFALDGEEASKSKPAPNKEG